MKKTSQDILMRVFSEMVRGKQRRFIIPAGELKAPMMAPVSARATSFATLKDLEAYIRCLQSGKSSTRCYAYGDNGRGAWGDLTAQLKVPMAALSPAAMIRQFGSSRLARGKKILVTLTGRAREVICEVRDKGPDGVVDLNPAALEKLGLPSDTELNEPATWRWL
jgi:hypothetical protein